MSFPRHLAFSLSFASVNASIARLPANGYVRCCNRVIFAPERFNVRTRLVWIILAWHRWPRGATGMPSNSCAALVNAIYLFVIGRVSFLHVSNNIHKPIVDWLHGNVACHVCKSRLFIVHDTFVSVWATVIKKVKWIDCIEIVPLVCLDSTYIDLHEITPIDAVVLVVQANCVHEFMHNNSMSQACAQGTIAQIKHLLAIVYCTNVA